MKKNDLNVLRYGLYGYRLRYKYKNIPQIFRNIKYAYQRITRGWCDQDIWNMNIYLSELLPSMLEDLAKNHYGHPSTEEFYDEQAKQEGFEDGHDKWTKTLEEMAYHFKNCNEDSPYNRAQKKSEYLFEQMCDNEDNTWFDELPDGCFEMKTTYKDEKLQERLNEQWRKEIEKSGEFINSEKDKACDMLKKYFFNLWD